MGVKETFGVISESGGEFTNHSRAASDFSTPGFGLVLEENIAAPLVLSQLQYPNVYNPNLFIDFSGITEEQFRTLWGLGPSDPFPDNYYVVMTSMGRDSVLGLTLEVSAPNAYLTMEMSDTDSNTDLVAFMNSEINTLIGKNDAFSTEGSFTFFTAFSSLFDMNLPMTADISFV